MPLGLLIPLLTPFVTELFKWIFETTVTEMPKPIIPLFSAAVGGACVGIAPLVGVDPGVSLPEGVALGLAGTGVHQMKVQTVNAFKAVVVCLFALSLMGCSTFRDYFGPAKAQLEAIVAVNVAGTYTVNVVKNGQVIYTETWECTSDGAKLTGCHKR